MKNPIPYLTDTDLEMKFDGTPNSRYGKVKRLIKQNKLLHIRRGLYCLAEEMGYHQKLHPFELAQYIYAPSYISLESALSFHKLIPEAVYTVTSVCIKRSKEFHTPLGIFSYSHLPLENFYVEVDLTIENNHQFYMAKPWKALCDYVYCYKIEVSNLDFLLRNLRINTEDLPILREEEREQLKDYYHHNRLNKFLKIVSRDFKA